MADTDRLIVVLGDQLNRDSAALAELSSARDTVWMAEAEGEATHVWSHKARIALFLSAMRHFRDTLKKDGIPIIYHELDRHRHVTLGDALTHDLKRLRPREVVMVQAGEHRVQTMLSEAVAKTGAKLICHADRHFLCSRDEFEQWSRGRSNLRMEHFYRHMRRKTGVLMDEDKPAGGRWNYDAQNRRNFGQRGPGAVPPWPAFPADALTRGVIRLVSKRFARHPGSLDHFDWPVTPQDAREALDDFVTHRLPGFGPFQDAMWTDEPFLYHSGLSSSLNLKLLHPRRTIQAAETALAERRIPIASVEGFIRQILGWREHVRGVYWHEMPEYEYRNALDAALPLPSLFWTGETEMECLRSVITQTLRFGYAHHIQRLMVVGLYALLIGVLPHEVHRWFLAVYVDAVEWVELPNTLGMSQFADGGIVASKPYVASGRYIQRMSNYCSQCRYDPKNATGRSACPFTTLYWDFLMRHDARFAAHPRTALQWRQLRRLSQAQRSAIRSAAERIRRDRC